MTNQNPLRYLGLTYLTGIATVALCGSAALASSFWPGSVQGIPNPTKNPLNIRSTALVANNVRGVAFDGDSISLTGRCKTLRTNGTILRNFRIDTPQTNAQRNANMHAARTWCQVWHAPTLGSPPPSGGFENGWVATTLYVVTP